LIRQTKGLMLLSTLAAASLIALGCGGGNNNSSSTTTTQTTNTSTTKTTPAGGGASSLKVSADPSGALKFDKSKLSAKAGAVTISMDNPASLPHGIGVKGNGVDKVGKTVNQGGVSTISVDLKAGTYTFFCPVPGHEAAGMKGTLTVK
jgi:plastocyanin